MAGTVRYLEHPTARWSTLLFKYFMYLFVRFAHFAEPSTSRLPHDLGPALKDILPSVKAKISIEELELPFSPDEIKEHETDQWKPLLLKINDVAEPKRLIVYLHGGAFVHKALSSHYDYLAALCESLEAEGVMLPYRLAPFVTVHESMPAIVASFAHLERDARSRGLELILAGDSAGGGLAVALTHALKKASLPQPAQLVLLSPWLDCTQTCPRLEEFARNDPWLPIIPLRFYGWLWAAGSPMPADVFTNASSVLSGKGKYFDIPPKDEDKIKHTYASPLWADIAFLKEANVKVTLCCGTADMIYSNALEWAKKCEAAGVECTFITGKNTIHIYALFGASPLKFFARESETALRWMIDSVKAYSPK